MAITSGFFNSLDGDRKYDARQMSEIFDGVILDGVFMSVGDALKTVPSSGMTVAVGSGRAWFLHTWTKNDSDYLITVSSAESVLNRIDTIVLDVDNTEGVRANTIKLIKGTPASNAKRSTLINTEDHKQIPLADILVPAGATTLATTNITNIVGTSECPYVTGPLSIIKNDDILAAWQKEFDSWFEDVQDQLSGNVAGKLLNLIKQRVEKTKVLDNRDEVSAATEEGFVVGALAGKSMDTDIDLLKLRLDQADGGQLAAGSGRALKIYYNTDNATYGCWGEGLYYRKGYGPGNPNNWDGLMLTIIRYSSANAHDGYIKVFFSSDGHVYIMRQGSDGTVQLNWSQV